MSSGLRKKIAVFLLILFLSNILVPAAYALTSGPAQPEAQKFQPAGVSDMVDLFTGDFKYNIPLLDIDGYPVNLNYQSGVSMDDEASWVGLGWNVNVGAINRSVRGLPDDFSGDPVTTTAYTKPKVTVGGRLTAKFEFKGSGKLLGGNGSFSVGVFSDNYTGIGAELGANAGMSFSFANSCPLTAGLGLGIMSNTASGVDVSPNLNLGIRTKFEEKLTESQGLNASLGYNTRSGMKNFTLGASFGLSEQDTKNDDGGTYGSQYSQGGSSISYNTEPVNPKITVPYVSHYNSFSLDLGLAGGISFAGGGATGYKSVREIESLTHNNPAYGFLYAERGKNDVNAMMDFIREKENPIIPDLPDLPVPVHMPDIFSYTSQSDAGQFRLFRGGSGSFFDNQAVDNSDVGTYGADFGFGAYFHGGVTEFHQDTHNTTRKWTRDNNYLSQGDFQDGVTTDPSKQHVYFRRIGEKNTGDANMNSMLHDTLPLAVDIGGKTAYASFNGKFAVNKIQKQSRQINRTAISYLTAHEAALTGLDKYIKNYPFNDASAFSPPPNHILSYTTIPRDTGYRKPHHISEITITDEGGKRSVYGLPVYNIHQSEYSFAIGAGNQVINTNQVQVSNNNGAINYNKGIDNYYHVDSRPGYASSFLLTAILSPDYVDKTGDGITPDDLGTAIKFNYSKVNNLFRWRTPYSNATLNKCQLADADDDKGSIIYGEKELWYVNSIETKTKIVYFITSDRDDALGVNNLMGGQNLSTRQKKLTEIRLYSKSDMTKPIKVVKFEYGYTLCPGVPNSVSGGKLTLTKVYFEYGNTDKGKYHPYQFNYQAGSTPYGNVKTDRWGVYKPETGNGPFSLTNEQFPYTQQDFDGGNTAKTAADQNAAVWHLNQILLPTGGTINVNYESDDYAYVQNKKAMAMVQVEGLIKAFNQSTSSLSDAHGFTIKRQETVSVPANALQWFKDTYLNGSDYIYTKFLLDISTSNSRTDPAHKYDFIPCYAKVSNVLVSGTDIQVMLEDRQDSKVKANPIIFSGWQTMKNEYPRYAYPGFDRRIGDGNGSVASAVSAIASAVSDLSELVENFYQKAQRRGYCSADSLQKSFVRVTKVNGFKLGGGVRVKQIQISDNWPGMSTSSGSPSVYGQAYDYTTTEDGQTISSGVAAYEPTLGNDENPLHQPIPYTQSIKGSVSNFFDLEEPFGESFFPAASVGYSKVTVTDLVNDPANPEQGIPDPAKHTGYVVNEFYTAKDFPVRVNVQPLERTAGDENKNHYNFLGATAVQEAIYSQGYSVILNDMHGKVKANIVYNQSGSEVSSTVYYYNARSTGAGEMELVNNVNVVDNTGRISQAIIGRDIEFFTDFREQESNNSGKSIDVGGDVTPFLFGFPLPIPHWPKYDNSEYKLFRSACGIKVSQYYGVIDKVVKRVNGSSITTQNVLFDAQTGDPVLTQTQNEFNRTIYSLNIPAYWVYKGMGLASQNLGIVSTDLQTDANGVLSSSYAAYLQPGDELADLSIPAPGENHFWVANSSNGSNKILIDRTGALVTNFNHDNVVHTIKFLRSGFRNILQSGTMSIVSLNNPISNINGTLQLVDPVSSASDLTSLKVINASATTYDEYWGQPEYLTQDLLKNQIKINNAYCFTFCQGSNNSSYNNQGTLINLSDTTILLNNGFWGGQAVQAGFTPNATRTSLYSASIDTNSTTSSRTNATRTTSTTTYSSVSPTFSATTSNTLPAECGTTELQCTRSDYTPNGAYNLQWPINRCGMWLCTDILGTNLNEVMGFDAPLNVTESKTYYIGYGADNAVRVSIDSVTVASESDANSYYYWHIVPYQLTKGMHKLHVEFYNRCVPGVDNSQNPAIAGVEVYANTLNELEAASSESDLKLLFSTENVRGKVIQSFRTINGTRIYHLTNADGSIFDVCGINNNSNLQVQTVNPYVTGFLGNWRPYQTKVFQQKRNYDQAHSGKPGVEVRNAGYINNFSPYWYYGTAGWATDGNGNRARWVNANTVTLYDKYGQQLENKDALGRFSAAKFDFNGELPSAVASNAMNRDIYASSFEDILFKQATGSVDQEEAFIQSSGSDISSLVTSSVSHTGNYSLQLPASGITMTTTLHNLSQKTQRYLDQNANGEYATRNITGLYPNGFEPSPIKQYIFDAWVKDGSPTNTSVPINLTVTGIDGSPVPVTLNCKAIVEGWKLVEGTINMNSLSTAGTVTIAINGSGIYIDDIRIHPYDALMKTYVYDDQTLRLMAELDENCFATFYEYDDEGSLIRVKKETERGIMTLKESRSSYKKIQ